MNQSWTIGILCYNEEDSIIDVLANVQHLLKIISPLDNEIIIVNDGSSDNTADLLELAKKENANIKLIHHSTNLGIGNAILSVHKYATKENLCVISGDGETNVEEITPFSQLAKNTFISFYRKVNTTYTLKRNIFSYLNRLINKMFLNVNLKDVNWTKIYKTKDVKYLNLHLTSSLVESEICFRLLNSGTKAIEVESEYLQRTGGESHGVSLKVLFQAFREIFTLLYVGIKYRFIKK